MTQYPVVFALDSSGRTTGVAILQNGRLIYECYLATGLTHSETLLCLCDDAFSATGLSPADVSLYAVNAGPGSFTGLRIGLAAVKGLAFLHDTPCAGVSTLAALAACVCINGTVLAALDARRQEVYCAVFCVKNGVVTRLCADKARPVQDLAPLIASHTGPLTLIGDGAQLVYNAFQDVPGIQLYAADYQLGRASGVARAGAAMAHAGALMRPADLTPDYHRLSQAERERAEKEQLL